MPIDLSSIKEFIEDQMNDTLRITREVVGAVADVWDENTGTYSGTSDNSLLVYEGRGFISTQGWQPSERLDGGAVAKVTSFKLVLPLEGPRPKLLDNVFVMGSDRSPHLPGQSFIIQAFIESSFSVSQAFLLTQATKEGAVGWERL